MIKRHVVLVPSRDWIPRLRKVIFDVLSWKQSLPAENTYVATLCSAESITLEVTFGLLDYMSSSEGSNQWLQCDRTECITVL